MSYNTVAPIDVGSIGRRLQVAYGPGFSIGPSRRGYRSIVTDVVGPSGRYVLKSVGRAPGARERLKHAAHLSGSLRSADVPTPRALPLIAAGGLVWEDAAHAHVLYERASGRPFDPDDLEAWQSAGSTLGRIHTFNPIPEWVGPSSLCVEQVVREIDDGLAAVRGQAPPALLEALEPLISPPVRTADRRESVLVHGDYRAQNVLFEGGSVSAVLDLDESGVGDRLLDVAYAALFFQAVVAEGPPSAAQTGAFLDGYAAVCGNAFLFGLQGSMGLALARGMTLWCRIGYARECGRRHVNAQTWIQAYLPLLADPSSPLGERSF